MNKATLRSDQLNHCHYQNLDLKIICEGKEMIIKCEDLVPKFTLAVGYDGKPLKGNVPDRPGYWKSKHGTPPYRLYDTPWLPTEEDKPKQETLL